MSWGERQTNLNMSIAPKSIHSLMASEGRSFSPSLIENGWLNPDIMASLILEDGSVYRGKLFGAVKSVPGEVGKIF